MGAVLSIDDRRAADGRRTARITGGDEIPEIVFENRRGPLSPDAGADPFVLAALFPIMSRGVDLHVEGRVSQRLLENLEDLMSYWRLWVPERYRPVRISAEDIDDGVPMPGGKVMSAFSGGVDGAFTAYRHLHDRGETRPRLDAVITVHGADVPLEDEATFARVMRRIDDVLDGTDVDMLTVATNYRQVFDDWGHGHGTALAACMALFQPEYSRGRLGSSGDVIRFNNPWGSTPLSDHLMSTGSFEVRNDGAGFSRMQKVAALTNWPRVLDRLRVCWEGDKLDRNCGQCEKCQRTLLILRAVGVERPVCMPEDAGTAPLRIPAQYALVYRRLADYARREGRPEVAADVDAVLRRNAPRIWLHEHPRVGYTVRRVRGLVRSRTGTASPASDRPAGP